MHHIADPKKARDIVNTHCACHYQDFQLNVVLPANIYIHIHIYIVMILHFVFISKHLIIRNEFRLLHSTNAVVYIV